MVDRWFRLGDHGRYPAQPMPGPYVNVQKNPDGPQLHTVVEPVAHLPVRQLQTGIHPLLWVCWVAALCCIPAMVYLEESTVQNGKPDFRLGWIHLVPFVVASLLPWFATTTIRRRAITFSLHLLQSSQH